ncbi:MAG: DUF1236 domain-containing protein [Xanthobacteraceae bacterium]
MKTRTFIVLVAAALLSGATVASAAGMAQSNPTGPQPVRDTLTLTSAQQKTAWNDLHGLATRQVAPAGFQAKVGTPVPGSVMIMAVSNKAAKAVPALKPYSFTVVNHKLLIVNPNSRTIAEVITS